MKHEHTRKTLKPAFSQPPFLPQNLRSLNNYRENERKNHIVNVNISYTRSISSPKKEKDNKNTKTTCLNQFSKMVSCVLARAHEKTAKITLFTCLKISQKLKHGKTTKTPAKRSFKHCKREISTNIREIR